MPHPHTCCRAPPTSPQQRLVGAGRHAATPPRRTGVTPSATSLRDRDYKLQPTPPPRPGPPLTWSALSSAGPPVAQWIRATDFGSVGRGFESLRAGHMQSVKRPPGMPEGRFDSGCTTMVRRPRPVFAGAPLEWQPRSAIGRLRSVSGARIARVPIRSASGTDPGAVPCRSVAEAFAAGAVVHREDSVPDLDGGRSFGLGPCVPPCSGETGQRLTHALRNRADPRSTRGRRPVILPEIAPVPHRVGLNPCDRRCYRCFSHSAVLTKRAGGTR